MVNMRIDGATERAASGGMNIYERSEWIYNAHAKTEPVCAVPSTMTPRAVPAGPVNRWQLFYAVDRVEKLVAEPNAPA